eukprot:CAMPEP_0204459000 /NCGR_PEP_ID=MMETSP0471-20130131/3834_1 /ASSEMBLY_ACC=CAM_ASM_000602 /TAXON_ID=2969 /ORGANISM="Oxyrrhis marina" /LENGTH=31 /DNA_ID= /DNA_START= /DNA_END= /DNA_ORIENTATION=
MTRSQACCGVLVVDWRRKTWVGRSSIGKSWL